MTWIFSIITKPILIFKAYNDFEDIFSTKNISHLPMLENYDHTINLVDNK